MIPKNNELLNLTNLKNKELPSKTYQLDPLNGRVIGYCDGLEAMKQAVYLILSIERFEWVLVSWNYGIETKKLFGKSINFVIPELERYIKEALTQDDRIKEVKDFTHNPCGKALKTKFTVVSIIGNFESGLEVSL